jgi:hypothetical protein
MTLLIQTVNSYFNLDIIGVVLFGIVCIAKLPLSWEYDEQDFPKGIDYPIYRSYIISTQTVSLIVSIVAALLYNSSPIIGGFLLLTVPFYDTDHRYYKNEPKGR